MRRNVADVKKYLKGNTTGDEQVAEDDASKEDDTGRITEPQGIFTKSCMGIIFS